MKKNYYFIFLLALMNIFSLTAKTESSCTVTIQIDNPSNVIITTMAGHGDVLDFSQGTTFQLDDGDSPLQIEPAGEGYEILSVKADGNDVSASGDGKYRLGIKDGLSLVIATKGLSSNKTVTFSVTDPSHIIVKNGDNVLDIAAPIEVPTGTALTVTPASDEYMIEYLMVDGRTLSSVEGVFTVKVENDVLIEIKSKPVLPTVTFDIDFPGRITVLNSDNDTPIDLSSSVVMLEKGTSLTIKASDEKYAITSLKVDGADKSAAGDGAYHIGVTGNMTVVIKTSSTVPTVRFQVDKPENVKVSIKDKEGVLDVAVPHEMEKGTQLVIETSSPEVRIVSVVANGFKLTPAEDGKYYTSVAADMTIEIKTKGILPVLTFHVDAPERIKVMKGTEELDFSGEIELPEGTEIIIAPAADNFLITSVKAGENTLTPDAEKKYHVTVTGDMEFAVETSATLTLHIVQPEGGTILVFRGETELHEGDKVQTGEELTFKNTFTEGYAFLYYLLNGEKCQNPYTVAGSVDITVSGMFKQVPEDHAIVIFDIDNPLVSVTAPADGISTFIDPSEPYEIEKGRKINIYAYSMGLMIRSCTLNGVEVESDEDKPNRFEITIEENSTIRVVTEQLVNIVGENTYNAALVFIGRVTLKYKGETGHDFLVPVGETVELVAEPEPGYKLDFFMRDYNDEVQIKDKFYTVTEEDKGGDGIVVFKGSFMADPGAIENMSSDHSYYEAETMKIMTTGGKTQVYNLSGETVLSTLETEIDLTHLSKGMYIVKAQDRVFKLVKK